MTSKFLNSGVKKMMKKSFSQKRHFFPTVTNPSSNTNNTKLLLGTSWKNQIVISNSKDDDKLLLNFICPKSK
jgi:hypothetical protein